MLLNVTDQMMDTKYFWYLLDWNFGHIPFHQIPTLRQTHSCLSTYLGICNGRSETNFCSLKPKRFTGWPFSLCKTSGLLQNIGSTLAWPALTRPKRNFCLEVNRRFYTSWMVTLYSYSILHFQFWECNLMSACRVQGDTSHCSFGL